MKQVHAVDPLAHRNRIAIITRRRTESRQDGQSPGRIGNRRGRPPS
jgi:hypothetical protein